MTLTAKRIRKRSLRRGNGLETLADVAAVVIFILGSLIAHCFIAHVFLVGTVGGVLGDDGSLH